MASRTAYSTWTPQKPTLFDGHYLRNRSTSDIGVLGYICKVQHKEHSPLFSHIPPGTPCLYIYIYIYIYIYVAHDGVEVKVTNRQVAGSITDGVNGIFQLHNPSGRTMALGSTQPLTEMSTRCIFLREKAAGA